MNAETTGRNRWEYLHQTADLEGLPWRVRRRPPAPRTGQTGGVPYANFYCAVCGRIAATLELISPGQIPHKTAPPNQEFPYRPPGEGQLILGIQGQGNLFHHFLDLSAECVPELRRAVAAADARGLLELSPEFLPSYCRECDLHYCWRHSRVVEEYDDGYPDGIYAYCPKHHRRMVDD